MKGVDMDNKPLSKEIKEEVKQVREKENTIRFNQQQPRVEHHKE